MGPKIYWVKIRVDKARHLDHHPVLSKKGARGGLSKESTILDINVISHHAIKYLVPLIGLRI